MLSTQSDIKYIKGVGERRAELYYRLGISDVGALIALYPRKYEDRTSPVYVKNAQDGETVTVKATLITPVSENLIRRGLTLYKCRFSDGESIINVTIFNNKYLAKSLRLYGEYILYGKIEKNFTAAAMSSPKIERADAALGINPIYPASGKLTSNIILRTVKSALAALPEIPETLPESIRKKYSLISLDSAVRKIHFPSGTADIALARNRLIFEELLTLQLGLLKLKDNKRGENAFRINKNFTADFKRLLPFELTSAQCRAIDECLDDMGGSSPMNRLLQGDVGSGKTAVAAALCHTVVKNGFQCAMMAPTEILAVQHYEGLSAMLDGAGIKTALLVGSTKPTEKKRIKQLLADGEIDFVIGTHAVIQNDVEFCRLALVITDEQHRFGVKQRASLSDKSEGAHTLVMSATPIPRTLGLILYGDLDISVLDELPPGRQAIRTDVVTSAYHRRIYDFIKAAVARGERAYIVCPAVEESEELADLKSAEEYAEELANGPLAGINLAILHGKMKAKDKENAMSAFVRGDVSVLVATTVVEVGVDVPAATIMVIENAERFGLSQLHQLRGRIGRGSKKSYCILVSDSKSENARARLAAVKKYADGFKIADEDLKLRGPGDFFGERQHGLPKLKIADMVEDMETLRLTQKCAAEILSADPNLNLPQNKPLCDGITRMFGNMRY